MMMNNMILACLVMMMIMKMMAIGHENDDYDDHKEDDADDLHKGVLLATSPQVLRSWVSLRHTVESHIVFSLCYLGPGKSEIVAGIFGALGQCPKLSPSTGFLLGHFVSTIK